MNQLLTFLYRFFAPLTPAQRFLFGLLSFGVLAAVITLFVWASQPDYTMLFGTLSPSSAQAIVDELQNDGIPYELRDNGQTVLVPRDQVYNLRLRFASEGMAETEFRGYELFDASTLGMTDFMQRVNLKRALEGELSRTISSLEQVEFARVHLVLPERTPFVETTVEPTASVILNLNRGRRIQASQIDGIAALVAGSVEGLSRDNVIVLDQNGEKISQNEASDSDIALSSAQMKIRQAAEAYLQEKAQSMLERIVGGGNAIVRVTTDHDFEKLSRESELIDPESRTVISEETRTESFSDVRRDPNAGGGDANLPPALRGSTEPTAANQQSNQVKIRNYEVNQTREKYEKPVGEITKIMASVMINQKRETFTDMAGNDSVVVRPWTAAEITNITNNVRSTLGIDELRGDQLVITQFAFDVDESEEVFFREQLELEEQLRYTELLRWVIIVGALTFAFYVLYRILRQNYPEAIPPLFFQQRPEVTGGPPKDQKQLAADREAELERQMEEDARLRPGGLQPGEQYPGDIERATDVYRRKLSPEAQRRLEMKSKMFEEIKNFAEYKPEEAANMIRSLMMQKPLT